MTALEPTDLRAYLVDAGIAGDTATPRDNCVRHAIALADGDPDKALGIGARGRDAASVMAAVAALCGCSPHIDERDGPGVIAPDIVVGALMALRDRLQVAARGRERVLLATGHPTGLLGLYEAISLALTRAGATVLTPLDDQPLPPPRKLRRRRAILYLNGVGVLRASSDLLHTHESWPMDALLDALPEPPDLVVADHGFAGAAIARGLEVAAFTDVNDPAIAVAWVDGLVRLVVPCDDNLPPATYEPIRDFLLDGLAV